MIYNYNTDRNSNCLIYFQIMLKYTTNILNDNGFFLKNY